LDVEQGGGQVRQGAGEGFLHEVRDGVVVAASHADGDVSGDRLPEGEVELGEGVAVTVLGAVEQGEDVRGDVAVPAV
jgi:hypothetical protein